jgi:hypothetical protein
MHFEALIGPCCGDAILMWVGFGLIVLKGIDFEITKMKDMIELFVKVCQIED